MRQLLFILLAVFFVASAHGQSPPEWKPIYEIQPARDSNQFIVSKLYRGIRYQWIAVSAEEAASILGAGGGVDSFYLDGGNLVLITPDTTFQVSLPLTPTIPINNFLYVSQSEGNNSTAVRGDLSKMWADPWAARDSAQAGDVISVLDGVFLMDTIGGSAGNIFFPKNDYMASSLMTKPLIYLNEKGVRYELASTNVIPLFYDTIGVNTSFLGQATIKYGATPSWGLGQIGLNPQVFVPSSLDVEVDSLITGIGDAWRRPFRVTSCNSVTFRGNVLSTLFSSTFETLGVSEGNFRVDFKKGFLKRVDFFASVSLKKSSLLLNFDQLEIESNFEAVFINSIDTSQVVFSAQSANIYRDTLSVFGRPVVSLSIATGTRVFRESSVIIDMKNAKIRGVSMMNTAERRAQTVANASVNLRGVFDTDFPLVDVVSVGTTTEDDRIQTFLQNASVTTTAPAVRLNAASTVSISNSYIDVRGDTSAFLNNSSQGNLEISNSFIKLSNPERRLFEGVPNVVIASGLYTNSTAGFGGFSVIRNDAFPVDSVDIWSYETVTHTEIADTVFSDKGNSPFFASQPSMVERVDLISVSAVDTIGLVAVDSDSVEIREGQLSGRVGAIEKEFFTGDNELVAFVPESTVGRKGLFARVKYTTEKIASGYAAVWQHYRDNYADTVSVNHLIRARILYDLEQAGIAQKLDGLFFFNEDEDLSEINLVNPSVGFAQRIGTIEVGKNGWKGQTVAGSFIVTNLQLNALTNFTQDNAGRYMYVSQFDGTQSIDGTTVNNESRIGALGSTNARGINSLLNMDGGVVVLQFFQPFKAAIRRDATNVEIWEGAVRFPRTQASQPLTASLQSILRSGTVYSAHRIQFYAIGAALTDQEILRMKQIFDTYSYAIGS